MSTLITDDRYAGLSFDLTFARAEEPRRLTVSGFDGPFIDDSSTESGMANGGWSNDIDDWGGDPRLQVFAGAINECVHEALEWAQLNGVPMLDPHDARVESAITAEVTELVHRLWALRDNLITQDGA